MQVVDEELGVYSAEFFLLRRLVESTMEPGDLVLVWDRARENQKGRKLDRRWEGPRILLNLNQSKTMGFVTRRRLYSRAHARS
jgi:hypothetical protein